MAGKRVEVDGDEELARALRGAKERTADLSPIHRELVGPLLNRARAEAPVVTGGLAASLYPAVGPRAVGIQSALVYAAPIHFGWPAHGIEANPFLIRARDAVTAEVLHGYEGYLEKVLQEVTNESHH